MMVIKRRAVPRLADEQLEGCMRIAVTDISLMTDLVKGLDVVLTHTRSL
jgi:hypothetical protein